MLDRLKKLKWGNLPSSGVKKITRGKSGELKDVFSSHPGYLALHEQYYNDPRYQDFFLKLRIEGDDIIFDNKKFALLQARHNGKDIFSGNHQDKYGNKGMPGLTYMTGEAAIKQAKQQGKQLFRTTNEVNAFIDQFPGDTTQEKVYSFVTLFGLPKGGLWFYDEKIWGYIDSIVFVTLCVVSGKWNNVYGVGDFGLTMIYQHYMQPVLAFEPLEDATEGRR